MEIFSVARIELSAPDQALLDQARWEQDAPPPAHAPQDPEQDRELTPAEIARALAAAKAAVPAPAAPPAFLSPAEVAARLGVSEHVVRDLLTAGTIAAIRVGRLWKVSPEALDSYLEAAQHVPSAPRAKASPLAPTLTADTHDRPTW